MKKLADSFLSQFTEAFRQVKIGDPLDESTTLARSLQKDALETLTRQVNDAVKNGAKLHLGGKPAQREGSIFRAHYTDRHYPR